MALFNYNSRLIRDLLEIKGKVVGIIQVLGYGHRPSKMKSSSDLYDWFMEVRFMFKVEWRCLMDPQNTVTYIGGEQTLAELGSTRGLGRIELISQESKYMIRSILMTIERPAFSNSRNHCSSEVRASPEEAHCIWKTIWECSYSPATALSY